MAEKTMNEKEKYLDEIEDKIRTIGVLTRHRGRDDR